MKSFFFFPTFLWLLFAPCAVAQPTQDDVARRDDITVLVSELSKRHQNPFTVRAKKEFLADAKRLSERCAALDEASYQLELMALVASLGDSHTRVAGSAPFASQAPRLFVSFYRYGEGFCLQGIDKERKALLGQRLTKVGGVPLETAIDRLGRFVVMENEATRWTYAPQLLPYVSVLESASLKEKGKPARFTLEAEDGSTNELIVEPLTNLAPEDFVQARPQGAFLTAWQQRSWHWHRFLKDEGLLYVQYNRCASSSEFDLEKLGQTLEELCAKGAVKTLVFDLQYNGGGNSLLGDALFARLAEHAPMRDKKRVFCVIGRRTFSSAILNALRLKDRYGAVLVGEPTSGSPNHFGEVKTFTLPHSKLLVAYSTKRFTHGDGSAITIAPDHLVQPTFEDLTTGRDAILEAIQRLAR